MNPNLLICPTLPFALCGHMSNFYIYVCFHTKVPLLALSGSQFHVHHSARMVCSLIQLVDPDYTLHGHVNISGQERCVKGFLQVVFGAVSTRGMTQGLAPLTPACVSFGVAHSSECREWRSPTVQTFCGSQGLVS